MREFCSPPWEQNGRTTPLAAAPYSAEPRSTCLTQLQREVDVHCRRPGATAGDGLHRQRADSSRWLHPLRTAAPSAPPPAMTGLRRGEAVGLRWPNVDLAVAEIVVREQLVGLNVAADKRNTRPYFGAAHAGIASAHRDIERKACRSSWTQRRSAKAGARLVRLHDLRHGAASVRLATGTDIVTVSKIPFSSASAQPGSICHRGSGV